MKIRIPFVGTLSYLGRPYYRMIETQTGTVDNKLKDSYAVEYKMGLLSKWKIHTEWEVYRMQSPKEQTVTIEYPKPENAFPVQFFSKEKACAFIRWQKYYDELFANTNSRWYWSPAKRRAYRKFDDVYGECSKEFRDGIEDDIKNKLKAS